MTDRDKVKYFFRAIFLLGSIPLLFSSVWVIIQTANLQYSGVKVDGIVTKKAIVERPLHDSSGDTYDSYELDYTFHAEGRKIARKGKIISRSNWEKLSEGDVLKIVYERKNPDESLPECEVGVGRYFTSFLLFLLGLAGFIYGFYFEPKR
jgi:hypothetical protein